MLSFYGQLDDQDLIQRLLPELEQGIYYINSEGKITAKRVQDPKPPWLFIKMPQDRQCFIYHKVMFEKLGMIHSRCHECWKVVARPKTVEELFQLEEIMVGLDRHSKLGVEVRKFVPALYGAYFYNNSKEEGFERLEEVRGAVHPHMEVYLKRGCTEFELRYPDSSTWQIFGKDQIECEEILRKHMDIDEEPDQPELVKVHVKRRWIEYAFEHGDMTYLQFTDGKSLFDKPRIYERSDNATGEEEQGRHSIQEEMEKALQGIRTA